MSYSINWYIENEIIYTHYSGIVTADEMRDSMLAGMDMIDKSPRQLVHTIADVGDVTEPLNPKIALEITREVGTHERSGWNFILRETSLLIKIGVAFGTSVLKIRTRTFDTMDELQEFLSQQDTELQWDKADKTIISA